MKRVLFSLSLTAIWFSVISCRENNPKATTPADTNQIGGCTGKQGRSHGKRKREVRRRRITNEKG